jgi:hypothetical protein
MPVGFHQPNPEELAGYCAFNVLKTQTRADAYFRKTVAADGTETYTLTGASVIEVKNQSSGKTLELNIAGPAVS